MFYVLGFIMLLIITIPISIWWSKIILKIIFKIEV